MGPSSVIAIDPGQISGWATFHRGELYAAGVMTEAEIVGRPPVAQWAPVQVVIEVPRIYPLGRGKGDPNDLISLALLVGELRGFYRRSGLPVELVEPRRWKGTTPKKIHNRRVKDALAPEERAILPTLPEYKAHNMIDAVGLGLWWLKKEDMR